MNSETRVIPHGNGSHASDNAVTLAPLTCQVIDANELAARWNLPASWIREQTRSRAVDPIPHFRFGRYVRFQWGDPELTKWLERRRGGRK
jgi:hypothetical protein